MKTLEIVAPSEDVGRDTISRFDMQFQAAAYAALEILDGNGIDCVYCDYHDDFVVRRIVGGTVTYHFFQVKTKKKLNHQWDLAEVFAFKLRGQKNDAASLSRTRKSFAGKLLVHGVVFADACREATLLSNVHFNDDVVQAVDQLRGDVPKTKAAKFLEENFSAIFTVEPAADPAVVASTLGKLSLRGGVSYIGQDRETFANAARSAIFKYSEIDLNIYEIEELATGLVDLVYRKSKTPLEGLAPSDITSRVGVELDDLLSVLSISRTAYEALLAGSEPKALKAASVIQRWLKGAGADDSMIEFASQQKVSWDVWVRNARHVYSPMDLAVLLDQVDRLYERWAKSGSGFSFLNDLIVDLAADEALGKFAGLNRELLFGAVSSVVVRRISR